MSNDWKNVHQPKFFERFKASSNSPNSPKKPKTQNIIHICEDVYYYWRSYSKTIIKAHSWDIWESNEFETPYEEWALSTPLPFHATHLNVRKVPNEICLLWGPLGAAVVTFPVGNKSQHIANCKVIHALNYISSQRLNIIQAKWHPSTVQSIIVILNNDNFIRIYSPEKPEDCLFATPAGALNSVPFRNFTNSTSIDATVDFDFGPHLFETDYWTVFLLKSGGTISYLLMKFIGHTTRTVWEEEKTVTVDGELEDMLEQPVTFSVGKTLPLLITIASLGGSLYHTILLPFEAEEGDLGSVNLETSLVSGNTTLHVKEVVALDSEDRLHCTQIIPDPICSYRYACLHQEGVHLVTVNFISLLKKLLSGNALEDPDVGNGSNAATCTYLISFKDDKDKNSNFVTASFSDFVPQKFIAVLGNGETLVAEIPKFSGTEFQRIGTGDGFLESPPKLGQIALNAVENVTSILSRSSNQLLASVSPEMNSENKGEYILDSVRNIQKEYIFKQEQALKFLTVATTNLLDRIERVREPLNQLKKNQPIIRAQAEDLAEKYEELNDNQTKLFKRFQRVMSHHRSHYITSDEERKWAEKMKEIELSLPQINDQVEALADLAHDSENIKNVTQQHRTPDRGTFSPRQKKISAMDLLNVKREVIQHQKALAELTQSILEINDNIC